MKTKTMTLSELVTRLEGRITVLNDRIKQVDKTVHEKLFFNMRTELNSATRRLAGLTEKIASTRGGGE